MEVLHQPGDCRPAPNGCVVTIGAYDGVHVGHRRLIARLQRMATELGSSSAVVTFDRHPATVVRPESAPPVLTDLDQKLELLAGTGVATTLVVHFDEERSQETAEEFVRDVLVDCLGARAVIVGHDFHFGYQRRGNVELLQRMGAEHGFDVTGIRLFTAEDSTEGVGNQPVSSTRIRQLLAAGDVEEAAALLGRPHQVRGRVEHGDKRGRQLGFPTANVAVPAAIALPADGVYAGWYRRPDGLRHPAALSLGRRPTFYEETHQLLLEAHLLNFEGDLYDEGARVEFVATIRPQARFASAAELVNQMGKDVAATRHILDIS